MARKQNTAGNGKPLKAEFGGTMPTAYKRAAGSPTAVTALSSIDRRASALKVRIAEHFKKFEDRWTAKEALNIWKRHLALHAKHPAPSGVSQDVSSDEIMKMAARNVRARANRRLFKVNDIKTRMGNAVVRNLDQPDLSPSFRRAADRRDAPARKQRRNP